MKNITILTDGPEDATETFIFAHGAGAAMDSPFMTEMARNIGAEGIKVIRFEFPYMAERRHSGKRSPPNRQPVLLDCWQQIINQIGSRKNLFIGGKSMGGRMASLLADSQNIAGLVCLGYPFHAPGKPEKLRTEHLMDLQTPCLICQGDRDPFGKKDEVVGYQLSDNIQFSWIPDGEHSFKPRKKSGFTEQGNIQLASTEITQFIQNRS